MPRNPDQEWFDSVRRSQFCNEWDLATLLGLPIAYVRRLGKSGLIPYIVCGHSRYYDHAKVQALLSSSIGDILAEAVRKAQADAAAAPEKPQ